MYFLVCVCACMYVIPSMGGVLGATRFFVYVYPCVYVFHMCVLRVVHSIDYGVCSWCGSALRICVSVFMCVSYLRFYASCIRLWGVPLSMCAFMHVYARGCIQGLAFGFVQLEFSGFS